MSVFKYVGDGVQVERLNMEMAIRYQKDRYDYRIKHAVPSQNVFHHMTLRAESVGMKINARKTKALCRSDALSFIVEAYIEDSLGENITSAP